MRWFILLLLFFGAIINFADKSIVGLAAVPIMEEFNLSYTEWGLVGSSYYWLFPIGGIIGGALSDRIGAKRVLGFVMLMGIVLQFGVLAITALPLLIIYRILLGLSEGPYSAVAYSHADRWFPPKQKGLATSIIMAGNSIGATVLVPVLVALIAIFGWRVAFAILGGACIVWLIFFQFTKETPGEAYKKIKKEQNKRLEKIKIKDLLLLLASPNALLTILSYFSVFLLITWGMIWQPLYLVEAIGMSNTQMGYSVAIIGAVSICIYMSISMLSDYLFRKNQNWRLSRVYVVAVSMILGALSFTSIVFIQNPIWVVTALSVGKGLIYVLLTISPTIIINENRERGGLMTSILTSSSSIAGMVGPTFVGFIMTLAGENVIAGYNSSILVMSGLIILFGILFAIFVRPKLAKNQEELSNVAN